MFFHITETKHNYNEIYNNNIEIFKECDYQFERYTVFYSLCLIKLDNEVSEINIDFLSLIRLTDRYIKIDDVYHLFLFTHSNYEQVTQTILKIEKIILNQMNTYKNNLLNCCIIEKKQNISSKEMLLKSGIEIEEKHSDYINVININ